MPVETHRRPRCLRIPIKILTHTRHIYIYLNILINTYFLLIYIHIHGNNVRALNRHVGLWWVFNVSPIRHICWSPIWHVGFRWVSDVTPIRHVGLRWDSNKACRSQMGLRLCMWVSDEACRGL